MELLTSEFRVSCDTYGTSLHVVQHEAKDKRKVQITVYDSEGEKKLSLWAEDAEALAGFLGYAALKSDTKL